MTDDREEIARARVGNVINDKWTLERLIGMGGMAAVYAGKHRNGARAAVKVLHPDIGRIPEVRQRFLREGYAANRVDHPGVVKVLDDDIIKEGADEGAAYIVMELLDGESLEDRLEGNRPVGERELFEIVRALLDILVVAHASGVVHRDLKPENLFLAREEGFTSPRIKILDFGLARVAEARVQTVAGLAIGTPSYMSPEQASGRITEIDGRSDLFSIGSMCFRILAGRTVHPNPNPLEIVLAMARDPAPKIRTVAPQVSAAAAEVIDRALEFERENRWQSASDMRDAVDRILAATGGMPMGPEIAARAVEVSAELMPPSHAVSPRPPARSSPRPPPVIVGGKVVDVSPHAPTIPESGMASVLHKLGIKRKKRLFWRVPLATALLYLTIGVKVATESPRDDDPLAADAGAPDAQVLDAGVAGVDVWVQPTATKKPPPPATTTKPTATTKPTTKPTSKGH